MITIALPIKTVNELNSHTHWRSRQRRAKEHRRVARIAVSAAYPDCRHLDLKCSWVIRVTRIAPSKGLDVHDGLPSSMKHLVDGVADSFSLPDGDPRFRWKYDQRRARPGDVVVKGYGVLIEILVRRAKKDRVA